MISPEITKKIKNLEIYTRKMVSGLLLGQGRSVSKGSGFDFDQIREYQSGDDVRSIDWKSSARMDKMLIKQYREERNQTVLLVVDISGSSWYGSGANGKFDILSHVAAMVAFIASYHDDAVGLLLFADDVQTYIPAQKGKKHVHMLLETLFAVQPSKKGTNIKSALEYIAQLKKKNMVIFLLSDFIDHDFAQVLTSLSRQHDVVAVSCLDRRETELPKCGFLTVQDQETGQQVMLNLAGNAHKKISSFLTNRVQDQQMLFKRTGVRLLSLAAHQNNDHELIKFFRKRVAH